MPINVSVQMKRRIKLSDDQFAELSISASGLTPDQSEEEILQQVNSTAHKGYRAVSVSLEAKTAEILENFRAEVRKEHNIE